MKPFKLDLGQKFNDEDKYKHFEFCLQLQQFNEVEDDIIDGLIFSNEAIFMLMGK